MIENNVGDFNFEQIYKEVQDSEMDSGFVRDRGIGAEGDEIRDKASQKEEGVDSPEKLSNQRDSGRNSMRQHTESLNLVDSGKLPVNENHFDTQ